MKKIKLLSIVVAFGIFLISCGNADNANAPAINKEFTATSAMTVSIEGMSCAKGCAMQIQNKIAGIPGITRSQVDFDDKSAVFEYDGEQVKPDDIINKIASLADGKYKATVEMVGPIDNTEKEPQS